MKTEIAFEPGGKVTLTTSNRGKRHEDNNMKAMWVQQQQETERVYITVWTRALATLVVEM